MGSFRHELARVVAPACLYYDHAAARSESGESLRHLARRRVHLDCLDLVRRDQFVQRGDLLARFRLDALNGERIRRVSLAPNSKRPERSEVVRTDLPAILTSAPGKTLPETLWNTIPLTVAGTMSGDRSTASSFQHSAHDPLGRQRAMPRP